ncbi:hypothetical protein ACJZTR_03845 [Neorickettsia risticii]|uniref:Membrane protein, putative n=1 Tax=Neorickettsia risticii (strain Illinois) TaxID=434131 RepID=C6V637_NEORI|nr:hypothetical protein [Neorickettsia risticii]ACT69858.1 membrane protein, putative [Neorickettsia risticii str. Illinois]
MFLQLYDVILGGVFFGSFAAVAAVLMSPLQFLKIMRQQTRASYRKIALDALSDDGLAPFFRGALPYAVMNFLSSMSFGISEAISGIVLKSFFHPAILFVVLFRSMMGGLLETLFSVWAEMCEISRNKGALMENRATFRGVALPILLRNMIFWSASVASYEISIAYHMNLFSGTAIGLVFGIFAALFSIPLDVVATRNCGARVRHGILACAKAALLREEDARYLLYGTVIRVIQIAMFTLVTLLTMFAFEVVFHS